MTKTPDFTAMFQDMFKAMPMDTKMFEDAFKDTAAFGEKFAAVALEAADKSTDVSTKWTKTTLDKMGGLSKPAADPADAAKTMTDFASASAETAAEHMAAFAEIAKKVQLDTVELMLAAGKEMSEEATAAAKKATDTVTKAAKKAAA